MGTGDDSMSGFSWGIASQHKAGPRAPRLTPSLLPGQNLVLPSELSPWYHPGRVSHTFPGRFILWNN